MSLPVARTRLEAEVYLGLLPCEHCGEPGSDWAYAGQATVDGQVADQFVGECPTCGAERSGTVARSGAPTAGPAPRAGADAGVLSRFGGAAPSGLLDAGQWLAVAGAAEALATMDDTSDPERLSCVEYARDAYLEALKFLPPGAASVPGSALFSDDGRRAARDEPLSLTRDWLGEQVSDAAEWADQLRTAAGSPTAGTGPDAADEEAVDEAADLARARTHLRADAAGPE